MFNRTIDSGWRLIPDDVGNADNADEISSESEVEGGVVVASDISRDKKLA